MDMQVFNLLTKYIQTQYPTLVKRSPAKEETRFLIAPAPQNHLTIPGVQILIKNWDEQLRA